MAQANAHLKSKSKSSVPTSADAPYVSGEVADGAASQRTEAQARAKRGKAASKAASAPMPTPSALPKALQGKAPLDYVTAPVSDPDAYALKVTGNCMEPLIRDGDIAIVTPGAELRRGMRRYPFPGRQLRGHQAASGVAQPVFLQSASR